MVSAGSNIFNFIRARKLVIIRPRFSHQIIRFLKPALVLFGSIAVTQIYINSDVTILGYMTSDEQVGLYNTAVKFYHIVKSVLLSVGTVSMPHLATCFKNKNNDLFLAEFDYTDLVTLYALYRQ